MTGEEINKIIIQEIFYFVSLLLILLFILEIVLKGLVSVYLNFNFLIVTWLFLLILNLKTKNV